MWPFSSRMGTRQALHVVSTSLLTQRESIHQQSEHLNYDCQERQKAKCISDGPSVFRLISRHSQKSPTASWAELQRQLYCCRAYRGEFNVVSHVVCRLVNLRQLEWVGERVSLTRTRIQAAHGTVPLKCARTTLPAPPGILYRPALGVQRCRLLPT